MIHAVTHGAIHSLCSCAGHMRNMISQHLLCPWKFLSFAQPSRPLPRRCCPDREAGAGISQRAFPQTSVGFAVAFVSSEGPARKSCQSHVFVCNRQERSQNSSWHSSDSACLSGFCSRLSLKGAVDLKINANI